MCLPLQEEQTPRRLHEKATTKVCLQPVQTALANSKQSSLHVRFPNHLLRSPYLPAPNFSRPLERV